MPVLEILRMFCLAKLQYIQVILSQIPGLLIVLIFSEGHKEITAGRYKGLE
jgi:hypothetical protein